MAVRGGATPPPPGVNGEFVPRLLPEGLFDDDQPEERWAVHPGFAPTQLLVSNLGAVRTPGRWCKDGEYEKTQGSLTSTGYRTKRLGKDGGKLYKVHTLVCEAWNGPAPTCDHTVDHLAKYDGDFNRERSDNRACNLRWATKSEQIMNQKARRAQSTGKPLYGRRVGCDDWRWYSSATAASKELGINERNISTMCKGKDTQTCGHEFKYDEESLEPQHDLPPIPEDSNPEAWKEAPDNGGRLWISTRGRVQTKNSAGCGFGPKRTPKPSHGQNCAVVNYQGRLRRLHVVIWLTFYPNRPTVGDETIDHKDQDPANNALWNLRPLGKSGQSFNRTMPEPDNIARPRTAVRGWVDGKESTTTEQFVSINGAVRTLNQRFQTFKFKPGGVHQSIHKKYPHSGWRFVYAETKKSEASKEQRVRVLAAIAALPVA